MFRLTNAAVRATRATAQVARIPHNQQAYSVLARHPAPALSRPAAHAFAVPVRSMAGLGSPAGFLRVFLTRGVMVVGGIAGTTAVVADKLGNLDWLKTMKDAANSSLDALSDAGEIARGALFSLGNALVGVAAPGQLQSPTPPQTTTTTASTALTKPIINEAAAAAIPTTTAVTTTANEEVTKEQIAIYEKKIDELQKLLDKAKIEGAAEVAMVTTHFQQSIDELRKENNELRNGLTRYAIASSNEPNRNKRAVDLFSDILALQAQMDKTFNTQEHLPRIVVVGDQSAGKTSVLEVIAEARIFPRGAGEMMTRSPIQVSLSESPYRKAEIKGLSRVFHLDNEQDLAELRKEVETRMKASVKPGESVSHETIAIDVRGPGLRPMVLVDLPGIIQHQTKGMGKETRFSIQQMCEEHINNPNAIILCIQDGSRDPESSSVAEIVKKADPKGERTIFVLTKVDLAEQRKVQKSLISDFERSEV